MSRSRLLDLALARLASMLTATAMLITQGAAAEAPQALRGKSIAVSWRDKRTTEDVASGALHDWTMDFTLRAYFSTKGRTFSNYGQSVVNFQSSNRVKEEVSTDARPEVNWRFAGKDVIVIISLKSGVRRLDIEVDGDHACTVKNVVNARLSGAKYPIVMGLNSGVLRKLVRSELISSECSIRDGNIME